MTKKQPLFSIITCTKNSEKFVKDNIKTVGQQTFGDYEHIFIDGFSTDKTYKYINSYKNTFPDKVKIFESEPKGISNAFNRGIIESKGRHLIFLNSDDAFHDKRVLSDVALFLKEHPNCDWVYGIISVIEENGKKLGMFPRHKIFKHRFPCLLKFINYIPHQAVFIKREVFDNLGLFDESLSSMMDYEYWLRIGFKTRWTFINRIISNYKVHENSQSSSKRNNIENLNNKLTINRRYLNKFEFVLVFLLDLLLQKYNKTTR